MLVAAALPVLPAQPKGFRPPPNYVTTDKPDRAEGARVLGEFRTMGIVGDYWLEFELQVMPRAGAARSVAGQLLGSRNESGPITRLTLPGSGGLATERRWLIQGGPQSATWLWNGADGQTSALPAAGLFEPLGGTDLTLFDLQMPFLYWTDFVYEGLARVRGRPAHSFVLYPPADIAVVRPGLTGVRVLLDTQFQALVQAEFLGAKGTVEKTISVLDLKKVGTQWMVKSIDLRNSVTRDKTRFSVTAAALNLALPAGAFSPAALAQESPVVPPAQIERF
ncbi:MAG: outer membrane lipoprotein-sorting protein [Lacunisphaera sp.]|nr:outer membrane lipoprotein-sorting protein [Lacunisphaera sp.]